MNRKQARIVALRWAYEAIQKAVDCGPTEDINGSPKDQAKCDNELDLIAQRIFDQWQRAGGR